MITISINTHTRVIDIRTDSVRVENDAGITVDGNGVPHDKANGHFTSKGGGTDVAADGTELNTIDISKSFDKVQKDPNKQQEYVEKYIGGLLGRVMESATQPLKIQFGEDEKAHIIRSNKDLAPNQKERHNAALLELDKIISACKRIQKDGTVKSGHNTRKATIERKQKVAEYVYFKAKLKAAKGLYYSIELATERRKNSDPNILTLYNVHVKRI